MMKRDFESSQPSLTIYDLIRRAIGVAPHERDELLFEALNDVYKRFSHTDFEYIDALSGLEIQGWISKDEKLLLFVLEATAREVGPYDLKKVRAAIIDRRSSEVSLEDIDRLFMHEKLKYFLKDIVVRLGINNDTASPQQSSQRDTTVPPK